MDARLTTGKLVFFLATTVWMVIAGIICPPAGANEGVVCRYLKAQGREIIIEVAVTPPSPSSLIIVQQLPKGVRIVSASPPVKKFDINRNQARWLIMAVKTPTTRIRFRLDKAVEPSELSGEARYKDPVTGSMTRMAFFP